MPMCPRRWRHREREVAEGTSRLCSGGALSLVSIPVLRCHRTSAADSATWGDPDTQGRWRLRHVRTGRLRDGLGYSDGTGDGTAPVGAGVACVPALGPVLVEFIRAEVCGSYSAGDGFEGLWPCSDGAVRDHTDVCGDAPVILPTWRRDRVERTAAWGEWVLVADVSCAGGAVPTPGQVLAEFRRLPVAPSVLRLQPDADQVLVGIDTIAYADDASQSLSTTLLGVPVVFEVSPVAFTWDLGLMVGSGSPFTTTGPGHAYPHQDVAYVYRHVGTGRVHLDHDVGRDVHGGVRPDGA